MEWSKLLVKKRVGNDFIPMAGIQSEFEMDYLKIITNQSFRRLQDKTQVFPLEKNDFIRTRLTHSLEVSYIGKLIVQKFGSYALNEKRYLYSFLADLEIEIRTIEQKMIFVRSLLV